MLEERGPGIWTCSAPLSLAGAQIGTRMTVVRLADEGLALIAPVEIDDELAAELAAIGQVRALIAPNLFHHFYFLAAAQRYPDAASFLAKGVETKMGTRPEGAADLCEMPPALWQSSLEQIPLEGAPLTNEVIFFHPASQTLILTDLCFNFDPAPGGWTGIFLWLAGARGRLAVSRLMRAGFKEPERLRASIDRILEWDFENLILTHGHVIEGDAKARFVAATRDL